MAKRMERRSSIDVDGHKVEDNKLELAMPRPWKLKKKHLETIRVALERRSEELEKKGNKPSHDAPVEKGGYDVIGKSLKLITHHLENHDGRRVRLAKGEKYVIEGPKKAQPEQKIISRSEYGRLESEARKIYNSDTTPGIEESDSPDERMRKKWDNLLTWENLPDSQKRDDAAYLMAKKEYETGSEGSKFEDLGIKGQNLATKAWRAAIDKSLDADAGKIPDKVQKEPLGQKTSPPASNERVQKQSPAQKASESIEAEELPASGGALCLSQHGLPKGKSHAFQARLSKRQVPTLSRNQPIQSLKQLSKCQKSMSLILRKGFVKSNLGGKERFWTSGIF